MKQPVEQGLQRLMVQPVDLNRRGRAPLDPFSYGPAIAPWKGKGVSKTKVLPSQQPQRPPQRRYPRIPPADSTLSSKR